MLFEGRPYGVALHAGRIYLSERGTRDSLGNHAGDGRLARLDPESLELQSLHAPAGAPGALAIHDGYLYWLERDASDRTTEIWRQELDVDDGTQTLLRIDDYGSYNPTPPRFAAGHLYFFVDCDTDRSGPSARFWLRMKLPE